MKKIILLFIVLVTFLSCDEQLDCCVNPQPVDVTLNFTHNWNGVPITASDFNNFKFTTENGELISIEKLRYVISNISVGNKTKDYQMINVGENTGLQIKHPASSLGTTLVKFTFGFSDKDNKDGEYQDLNSVSFSVPKMLGGGYHYMQFDGKYKDINNENANFNYHAIRAVNRTDPANLVFQDTSFEVNLGTLNIEKNSTVEVKVNIAEWFRNPNTWNLNELNTVLMPNFEAQKMMSANGKTVFRLGKITQQ